jgi:UDP:flavonoid glycosyltransferase YjiC (YdhE family)
MVCIPALAGDQAPIAALVEEWGVGRSLPSEVDIPEIRAAVEAVLSNADYAAEAQRRSAAFVGRNGAELAADSLATLL